MQRCKINIISYPANDGKEYFISWINDTNILLGFCRLRINSTFINPYFEELNGCSLLRELHIYGQVIQHETINKGYGVQHCGLGNIKLDISYQEISSFMVALKYVLFSSKTNIF